MDGLIYVTLALGLALAAVLGMYFGRQFRLRRLAEQMECFLVSDGKPLPFSVRENSLAPLHNAAAELENQVLMAREQRQQERQATRNLTADISHQLKTPLASLRLFCELDAGPHLAQQLAQMDRMEQLIQSLLVLERMCAGGICLHLRSPQRGGAGAGGLEHPVHRLSGKVPDPDGGRGHTLRRQVAHGSLCQSAEKRLRAHAR